MLALCVPAAAPGARAPDPGGSEDARLVGPPPGKEFGFSGPFHRQDIPSSEHARLIAAAGGNASRSPLDWWNLEKTRDVWNEALWAKYERTYSDLVAAGITPHFTITSSPPWSRDPGLPQLCTRYSQCVYPPAREMLGEWEEFLVEATTRLPSAVIEIWNEPNFAGQWRTGVDPARYAELLAHAYRAVKAVNPEAKVLMGGLGTSIKRDSLTAAQFLDGAYAATPSVREHTDAINFHVYPGPNLGSGSFFARVFRDIRAVRAKWGDETPLYVTETGTTTTGPMGASEDEQADRIMRTTRKALTMPDVIGVLIHTLVERPEYASDDPERGFGVMRYATTPPLDPKAAYCALTRAAGQLYSHCPPETRFTLEVASRSADRFPTFSFDSPDQVSGFECSLDGAAFRECGSPHRLDAVEDGEHVFAVRARGLWGRADPSPAERRFTIDSVPPRTRFDAGPGRRSRDRTPTFRFSSNEPAKFRCRLDRGEPKRCSSPVRLPRLRPGHHRFSVRAVDAVGNRAPEPARRLFEIVRR